jgi:hypothetical protein
MDDLYHLDYQRLIEPSEDYEDIGTEGPISTLRPKDVISFLHDLGNFEIRGRSTPPRVRFTIKDGDEYMVVYYQDGLVDRPDGPAVVFFKRLQTLVEFYSKGVLHREGGPARILFSKAADLRYSDSTGKGALGPSDYDWSSVTCEFFENGEQPIDYKLRCRYVGVRLWYPNRKYMVLNAQRVSFKHYKNVLKKNTIEQISTDAVNCDRINEIRQRKSREVEPAFQKASVFLSNCDVLLLEELWDDGVLHERKWAGLDANWKRNFPDSVSGVGSMSSPTSEVNHWLEENLHGRIDPFLPDLFSDQFDEWAFLDKFSAQ